MFQLARKYDFHPARRADGHWDPADNLQLSGPDPVSMADRSGNGRLLSYRSALGSATADTLNGLAAVRFVAAQNSFYSDSAGALVGAGANQPYVVYGAFKLDNTLGKQTIFTLDSSATTTDWSTLVVSGNSFYMYERSAAAGNIFTALSEIIVAGKTYTYVVRRNTDGTVDFWLNAAKIDAKHSFAGSAMSAMTRFSVGARDLTSYAPDRAIDGVFAATGLRSGAVDDAWCAQAALWLHQRYGGGTLVHDFHIGLGQGNFAGQPEVLPAYPATAYGTTYVYNGLSEGICEANYRFETTGKMNSNPGFAKKYYELSGRGSVWINAAVGNTSLLQAADNGAGWWDPRAAGNLYDAKKILVDKMLAAAQASPKIYAGRRIFHWAQGELDANNTNGTTVTAALYEDALNALFDQAKLDFGIDIFGIYELGHDALDPANANWTAIRTAQQNVIAARADTYSFNSKAHETAPLVVDANGDWVSGWGYNATNTHYTRDAYQAMGRLGADALHGAIDPHFSSVVLLASFDGADGATSAVDDSPQGLTLSCTGACALSVSESVFGSTSLAVNSANESTGRMEVSGPSNFDFGLGDFTIEGFARSAFNHNSWWHSILGNYSQTAAGTWCLWVTDNPENSLFFAVNGGPSLSGTSDWGNGTHHFAVSRNGGILRLFVDGVMEDKKTNYGAVAVGNPLIGLIVGGNRVGNSDMWRGYIDELRITNGVGRYGADSSFLVPSQYYPKM